MEIEVLDDGSGSLLGFGKAKVMLSRKKGTARKAEEFLTEIFAKMGVSANLNIVETDEEITYQIVGDDEADIHKNKISISSPIARAMIGKMEGDEITVAAPAGPVQYEIMKVEHL